MTTTESIFHLMTMEEKEARLTMRETALRSAMTDYAKDYPTIPLPTGQDAWFMLTLTTELDQSLGLTQEALTPRRCQHWFNSLLHEMQELEAYRNAEILNIEALPYTMQCYLTNLIHIGAWSEIYAELTRRLSAWITQVDELNVSH